MKNDTRVTVAPVAVAVAVPLMVTTAPGVNSVFVRFIVIRGSAATTGAGVAVTTTVADVLAPSRSYARAVIV